MKKLKMKTMETIVVKYEIKVFLYINKTIKCYLPAD